MKKIAIFIFVISFTFFLTGCENDANDDEKELIIEALQNENVLSTNAKYIGKKTIIESLDTIPAYDLDIYEDNTNYYAINFDKIKVRSDKDPKDCKYVITVYDNVKLLKDQEYTYTIYHKDTDITEKKTELRDEYSLKESKKTKYCGNKVSKIFSDDYIEISLIN